MREISPATYGSSPSGGATIKLLTLFLLGKLNVFIERDIDIKLEYRGWKNSCTMDEESGGNLHRALLS